MNRLILYIFLFLSLSFFGQSKETTYYDTYWNICNVNDAKYYREYKSFDKFTKTWKVNSYFINGTIQWVGSVKNNNPKATNCYSAKCHGIGTWFDQNGIKTSERVYLNGLLNGPTLLYNKNGIIVQRYNYINGEIVEISSSNLKKVNNNYLRNSSKTKYYKNSNGYKVQSPTYYKTQPKGATALCNDGTYSFSRKRRGTCSGHGGVRKWL